MAGLTPSSTPPGPAVPSPATTRESGTQDWRNLTAFRDTMNLTREAVQVARRPPADSAQLRTARVAHLVAMSQYEQALTNSRLPIPQRLHQQVRLLRRLLA